LGHAGALFAARNQLGRGQEELKEQTCSLPKAAMYKRTGFPLYFAFVFCITGGECTGNKRYEIASLPSFPTNCGGLKQAEK